MRHLKVTYVVNGGRIRNSHLDRFIAHVAENTGLSTNDCALANTNRTPFTLEVRVPTTWQMGGSLDLYIRQAITGGCILMGGFVANIGNVSHKLAS